MSIKETARAFFESCETGEGWDGCKQYCKNDAGFSAQSEPLLELRSLEDYANWMRDLLGPIPDGHYDLKSFAVDEERRNVCAYAVFKGTQTGEGGPVAPTGKSVATDYVYVMQFEGDKISHMTKVWHSGLALQALGWA